MISRGRDEGRAPQVDPALGRALFHTIYLAIDRGLVRSCHDLSEGGLAVALAEMAVAGGLGLEVSLRDVACDDESVHDAVMLFSESPSRFLLEVKSENLRDLYDLFGDLPLGRLGEVTTGETARLVVVGLNGEPVIDAAVADLKSAWQAPLRW